MRRDAEPDVAVDPVTVDDAVLREQIGELVDASHRRYAEILRAVDIFDRRGLCEGDGFRTTRAWLVGAVGMSGPAAARLVKAARLLRELPELSRAVRSGRVSPEHVQQVATLASRVDTTRLVEIDAILAEAALVLDVARFALVCQRAAAHLAPDGADPGADFDRRAVTLSPAGTMTALRGQLDPEGAAALHTALDALMTPPGAGDERTAAQRRADALVELARLHLAAGDLPTVGGQRPQVGVLLYPQALSPRALATLAHLQRDRATAARLGELAATDPDAAPMKPDPADMFGRTAEAMRADLEQPDVTQPESSQLETGRLESSQPDADTDLQDSAGTGDSATSPAVRQPSWNRPGWADPPWLQGVGPIPPEVSQDRY